MMDDGTEVDTDELKTFAGGMHDRGDEVLHAAEQAGSIFPNSRAFGAINTWFLGEVVDSASAAAEGLMLLGKGIRADGTSIRDAARDYAATEQNQVHRFGGATGD